jgi:hypothetical protein
VEGGAAPSGPGDIADATAPDGSAAWAPAKPRADETLIRALARAHRWKRLLEDGKYRSAGELAEADGVTRSFVNRLLRLTLLAPDIVEANLEGRQPKAMQLGELTEAIPSEWEKQWKALLLGAAWCAEGGRFSPVRAIAVGRNRPPVASGIGGEAEPKQRAAHHAMRVTL